MQTSFILALVASFVPALVAADTCTSTSCSNGCSAYDSVLSSCSDLVNNNTAFLTCACSGVNGLKTDVGLLNLCVACDDSSYGGVTPFYVYQSQTVICDNYLAYGEEAAMSIGDMAETSLIQQFSSTYLPIIQSGLCTGSNVNTGAYTAATSLVAGGGATQVATAAASKVSNTISTTVTAAVSNIIPGVAAGGTGTTSAASLSSGLIYSVLTSPMGNLPSGATVIVTKNAAPTHFPAMNMALLAVPVVGALL